MVLGLKGRRPIVVGASRGTGKAVAIGLSREGPTLSWAVNSEVIAVDGGGNSSTVCD
jgi:NAD(P)-dependent dehydrogenase (short-subunit alcohol dehydrogenase family)